MQTKFGNSLLGLFFLQRGVGYTFVCVAVCVRACYMWWDTLMPQCAWLEG